VEVLVCPSSLGLAWTLPSSWAHGNGDTAVGGSSSSSSSVAATNRTLTAGRLEGIQTEYQCITPGLTVAFPVGVAERDVPIFAHHELVYRVGKIAPGSAESCLVDGDTAASSSSCLDFVDTHAFEAIRSRTPTSAGMLAVLEHADADDGDDRTNAVDWITYALWDFLDKSFALSRVQVRWMQSYLTEHVGAIATDNLHGQCTTGHSCKPEARRDLERLVAWAQQHQHHHGGSST
jgi:hypothetical protein